MVDAKLRPIAPLNHSDAAEHRRLIAVRANAGLPKDGTEGMTAPLRLASYTTATLPDPAEWEGSLIYVSDGAMGQKFLGSDGTSWVSLDSSQSFTGVTDAAGLWTVTFNTPFDEVPHVALEILNPDVHTHFRMTDLSPTGFEIHVFRRDAVDILGFQIPSFTVTDVAGQPCSAMAFQQ